LHPKGDVEEALSIKKKNTGKTGVITRDVLTEVLATAKVLGHELPPRATMILDLSTLFTAHTVRTNLTGARTIGLRIYDMDGPALSLIRSRRFRSISPLSVRLTLSNCLKR
jgi:hypothetical protein